MSDVSQAVLACGNCIFWEHLNLRTGVCRFHAPQTGDIGDEVAHWPHTAEDDGCAAGQLSSAGSYKSVVRCMNCAYWHQARRGGGLLPVDRKDKISAWWEHAGHCRRRAPVPSAMPGHRGFWRVTNGDDGCAEGVQEERSSPLRPHGTPEQ